MGVDLNCQKMNIAAGYGNVADPMSPYCAHYPGSDFPPEKILGMDALYHVNMVGMKLLGRDDVGMFHAREADRQRTTRCANTLSMAPPRPGRAQAAPAFHECHHCWHVL